MSISEQWQDIEQFVATFVVVISVMVIFAIPLSLYLDNRAKRQQAERERQASKPYQRQWRDASVRRTATPLSDTSSDRRPADASPGPADYMTNPLHPASPLYLSTIDSTPACHDHGSSASSWDSGSSSSDSGCSSSD